MLKQELVSSKYTTTFPGRKVGLFEVILKRMKKQNPKYFE